MSIISFSFIAFFFLVFVLLYIFDKLINDNSLCILLSNWTLVLASFAFISYTDFRFGLVLLALILVTWYCGLHKRLIPIGISVAIMFLAYCKYTNFFVSSFENLFGLKSSTSINVILPVGVSFFTFSAIGYLIDIKRERIEPHTVVDVALYLSFFPKLTSGPIQRSKDFFSQTMVRRTIGWKTFSIGIQIFVFGLIKKIVFADRLSVFVDQVYATPNTFDSLTILLAVFAYSLQIYFDFSGYSDMAIGIAKIIGFDLPRNFNLPYLSHNVTEFWKRWHISLSSWLQDYLYISLGGNRKGQIRTYINLIVTMTIGGIWHGASWTFIIWGLLHGIALAVHKVWCKLTHSVTKSHSAFSNVISTIATFIFVSFTWVFFRAQTFQDALLILKRLFAFQVGLDQMYLWLFISAFVLCIANIFAIVKSKRLHLQPQKSNFSSIEAYYPINDLTSLKGMICFFVMCGLVLIFAYTGGSPFIYAQF